MDKILPAVLAIVGGIITIAIVSVIVGQRSRAPEAIGAIGNFVATVVASAVNPAATASTNGNPEQAAFSIPTIFGQSNSWNVPFPNIGGFGILS